MREVPAAVKNTFEALKKVYDERIELTFLKDRFCVFEAKSKYDPYLGRSRRITHYLGWITDSGLMVPARSRARKTENVAREPTGFGVQDTENKTAEAKQSKIDEHDKAILTALSMNSRIPYKTLSKIAGIPVNNIPYRIKRLEKEFDIKYTIELDLNKLGFSGYLILVKFLGEAPTIGEEVKKALEENPRIQLVMLTSGMYDLIVHCVAEDNTSLITVLSSIRTIKDIERIPATWYITPIANDYGFVPLRDKFFDAIKDRVWHRTKEKKRPAKSDLRYREFAVLKELNNDSSTSFSEIEKRYKLSSGSANDAYEKLAGENNQIIRFTTILVKNINIRYIGIIIMDVLNKSVFMDSKDKLFRYIIDETPETINRFAYIGDTEMPDGITYFLPVHKEGELEVVKNQLKSDIKGVELKTLLVSQVLLGNLGFRRFDNAYSWQYVHLIKEKAMEPKERTKY